MVDDDSPAGPASPETIQQALIELASRLMQESDRLRDLAERAIDESRRLRVAMTPDDRIRRGPGRQSAEML